VEALQLIATFACIAALFLLHPLAGTEAGRVLLAAHWALTLPVLGQEIGMLARQLPAHRNLTLRLLEPLGAPDEESGAATRRRSAGTLPGVDAPTIEFQNVSAEASGHPILSEIDLTIEAGTQLAIVGPSGAGKSSLVGIL